MALSSIDNSIALDALNQKKFIPSDDDVKLREQTDQFESFLLKQILDISLKSEHKLFGKDAGDKIYQSMYNDSISRAVGGNIGFSKMLFDFLKEQNNLQR